MKRASRSALEAIALPGWQEAGLTFVAIGAWLGVTSEAASDLARPAKALEKAGDELASRLRQA